jgi:hypothetical protein
MHESILKYPSGTLVAVLKTASPKTNYVYVGKGFILIFDLPDFTNLSVSESRSESALEFVDHIFQTTQSAYIEQDSGFQRLGHPDYNGTIEYIYVSPKNEHEGSLKDIAEFCSWARVMDRDDLSKTKLFTTPQLTSVAKSIKLHSLK